MIIMNCRLSATFQNPNYSWTQLLAIHNKVEEKKNIYKDLFVYLFVQPECSQGNETQAAVFQFSVFTFNS